MRFLIVDDDLASREFLSSHLSDRGVCNTASTGIQAVEVFRQALDEGNPYSLVILDARLADMDGAAVLRALRSVEDQHVATCEAAKIVVLDVPWLPGYEHHATESLDEVFLNRPQPIDPLALQEAIDSLNTPVQQHPTTCATDAGLRFLIVDDDRLCRVMLNDMLSKFGHCDMAASGEEAVSAIHHALEEGRQYDAVTLDILMPRMDGHETLKKLRAVEEEHGVFGMAATKVVMATASSNSKDCIRAFREGCESYVTKPIKEADLLAKLKDLEVISPQPVH